MSARLSPRRHLWLAGFDAAVWTAAVLVATLARLDFETRAMPWGRALIVGLVMGAVFTVLAWIMRLHQGRASLGTLDEMLWLGVASIGVGGLIFLVNVSTVPSFLPRSVPLVATFGALVVMAWARATARRVREIRWVREVNSPGSHRQERTRVLVAGAGNAGRQLIRSMRSDPGSWWWPVGLLDDNPLKQYLRIDGVPVMGGSGNLVRVADATGAATVVVAVPSADATFLRQISHTAAQTGIAVKVLPGVNELLDGRVGIRDIRDIDLPDLLGRHQIDTDVAAVADYLSGQRVLVTGAGGSIGSELCRQIFRWNPAELVMLDRDESALHAVQLSILGRAMLDSPDVVLADIRDATRIRDIFTARRPEVVFHAAALKHLPMLEQYPGEALKTNVIGTLAVLNAAAASGVRRFVNISTDKAANPVSVLGYSKRIAEGLTASVALEADGTYLSVRFGNVLGSRGSVLTAFAAQVAAGGPITVTHPGVTRYFMTIEEAVQLVIQAAAIGSDGQALVLDMGKPVKIDDVARHLIRLSGKRIEIQYTGLREGEKMHEDLFGEGEPDHRPTHPLVSHVEVPPLHGFTHDAADLSENRILKAELREACRRMTVGAARVPAAGAVRSGRPTAAHLQMHSRTVR
ncbi:MAG: polysaccharide biosynthesis protein [Nakamurella sp.]